MNYLQLTGQVRSGSLSVEENSDLLNPRSRESDPIPGPEKRFTCSQFSAYFAFSFLVVLAPIRRIVWTSDQIEFDAVDYFVLSQCTHNS